MGGRVWVWRRHWLGPAADQRNALFANRGHRRGIFQIASLAVQVGKVALGVSLARLTARDGGGAPDCAVVSSVPCTSSGAWEKRGPDSTVSFGVRAEFSALITIAQVLKY